MPWRFIRTYLTVGATFGCILAGPLWYAALAGRDLPRTWAAAKPLVIVLARDTGHGVLRAYCWLPSLIYHLTQHKLTFQQWLVGGSW